MEQLAWLFVEAFALAFLMVYFLLPKAARVGLVDWQTRRKRPARSVPLIGGLAIFITYLVVLGPTGDDAHSPLLLAGGGLLVLVGALDDYFDFPAWPRLAAQALAALCLPLAGVVISDIGALTLSGQALQLGVLAVPFTLFATVGMVNAFNMSDGIDGLSGSLSLVALISLGVIAVVAGHPENAASLVVLAAGIAGFLIYNLRTPLRRSAAAFLGDSGSMLLGFALTWFLISMSQGPAAAMAPACAVWLVALPLIDTLFAIMRRAAARRSPLQPDTRHFHHLLLRAGLPVSQTVAVLTAIAAVLAGVGVAGAILEWPPFALAAGFAGLFVAYCVGTTAAWRYVERRQQGDASGSAAEQPELAARGPGRGAARPSPLQSTTDESLLAERRRAGR